MSTPLNDLFRLYAIPPSPLHEAVQEAARQEGWTPPGDHEEQQSQKKTAGERSGLMRGGRAEIRRSLIEAARARLKSASHRRQPFSIHSIRALEKEYLSLFAEDGCDPDSLIPLMLAALSKTDRQVLIKMAHQEIEWMNLMGNVA